MARRTALANLCYIRRRTQAVLGRAKTLEARIAAQTRISAYTTAINLIIREQRARAKRPNPLSG